eukprot:g6403.t1 g6403   contig23:371648-372145(-)
MLLSLYMLLAYSWNTDFRFRYKSTEINYGLSEYWNGAIPSLGKIGKETGKLFNDYTGDEDVKAKLLKGVVANDNLPSASKDGIEMSIGDAEMDEKEETTVSFVCSFYTRWVDNIRRAPSIKTSPTIRHAYFTKVFQMVAVCMVCCLGRFHTAHCRSWIARGATTV